MMFTENERRLLILYHSGSVFETVATIWDALDHIHDPDELCIVQSILQKLKHMDEAMFDALGLESEV